MGTVSKEFGSIREAVAAWVGKLPMGTVFSLKELERNVQRMYPEYQNKFGHTLDRRLRQCREEKYFYSWYPWCVDENKSMYKKVTRKEGLRLEAERQKKWAEMKRLKAAKRKAA